MKTKKLTSDQLATMSYGDVAYLILTETGNKIQILDLFKQVLNLLELPESYLEKKIGDFFQLLSTDKRFVMLEKGFWDLRDNHSDKITISQDDEEEEEIIEEDSEDEEDNDEEEINYDDDSSVDDDEEEDDYKDLVIINDSDEQEEM